MAITAQLTTAALSHLRDIPLYNDETPYEIWADTYTAPEPRSNVQLEIVEGCSLRDVRDRDIDPPCLNDHGFEYLKSTIPSEVGIHTADDVGFGDTEQQERLKKYLQSVEEMLKQHFGCFRVVSWDWRVRRSTQTFPPTEVNIYSMQGLEGDELRATKINASHLVHSDGSPAMMRKVLASVMGSEEPHWLDTSRYHIRALTVWRPLVDAVETDPLVLCDTRTVRSDDWDIVEKVLDNAVEESMYLKHRDRHQWYWMSSQSRDEPLVMTIWDSARASDRSASVPHAAWSTPNTSKSAIPRESIEVRLFTWNSM